MSKMNSIVFVKGVIKDNWKDYVLPLYMAFLLPLFSVMFGQMSVFIFFSSLFMLMACWFGMLHRDMAESFRQHIIAQEHAMSELLAERFQAAIEKKLGEAKEGQTIHMELKVDEENNVHID